MTAAGRIQQVAVGVASVEIHLSGLLGDPQLTRTLSSVPGPGTRALESLRRIVNSPTLLAGLSAQIAEIAQSLDGPQEGASHWDRGL